MRAATTPDTLRDRPQWLPSRDDLLAERCRRSLAFFIRQAWPIVVPGTRYMHAWVVDALCEHLEAAFRREIRRLIINLPPRTIKSVATSVMWPAWGWLSQPELRWMFVSYSGDLSADHSVDCRTLVEYQGGNQDPDATLIERVGYTGLLRLLGQDWRLTDDQNLKTRYTTTAGGRRLASSVGAKATGFGGDIIVADDPHNAVEADSEAKREGVLKWWDGAIASRMNQPKTDVRVVVMQRLNRNDLTGHLLAKDDDDVAYTHLCLPMEYEPKHPFVWPDDPRVEPGALLWPERFDAPVVRQLRSDLGPYRFAGQYQQLPAPMGGGILKGEWWRSYSTPPPVLSSALTSWDLTFGSSADAGSWNVGQVWGVAGPNAYLLDEARGRWEFPELLEQMRLFAAKWPQARPILIENKASGAPAIATLRREIAGLVAITPVTDKVARAESVTPFIEGGNAYLPEWALGDPGRRDGEWVAELSAFPKGSADDRVDAMSQALSRIYLQGSAAQGATVSAPVKTPERLSAEQLRGMPM